MTEELQQENALLREQNATLAKQLKRVSRDYDFLLARFKARMKQIFGGKAERIHPSQLAIDFPELETIAAELAADPLLQPGDRNSKRMTPVRG